MRYFCRKHRWRFATIEGIFSDLMSILYRWASKLHSQNILLLFSRLINKEPACFSIINSMWNYGMCFTCWWGLVIWQKCKSGDLNEYIGMQNSIIVTLYLFVTYLLDLLLSEDSCKEREFGTERLGRVTGRGKCKLFQDKRLYSFVSSSCSILHFIKHP